MKFIAPLFPEFGVLMRFEEGIRLVVIGHLVKNAIKNFKTCTETSMATSWVYVHVAIPLQLVQCTDAVSKINMSAKGCEWNKEIT